MIIIMIDVYDDNCRCYVWSDTQAKVVEHTLVSHSSSSSLPYDHHCYHHHHYQGIHHHHHQDHLYHHRHAVVQIKMLFQLGVECSKTKIG